MKNTFVVCLFGGPGIGKSTVAASIFSKLKWMHIETEIAFEYAKDLVFEESFGKLDNQFYIFGKQIHRLKRVMGKVDVIVTDSPLPLSIIYDYRKNSYFKKLVLDEYNAFNNINFMLKRHDSYQTTGRMQSHEEAKIVDDRIINLLEEQKIEYDYVWGSQDNIDSIIEIILNKIGYEK
jgi:adenylate kinase family enzyme